MDEKKVLNNAELEQTAGGNSGMGAYTMRVGDCNGSYLALRDVPNANTSRELAQLYPGYEVVTNGETAVGPAVGGGGNCTYIKVRYNGLEGWVHSSFVY